MSLPSIFNNSHTIGKATPTAICESYDITVRCNAGKSLHLYRLRGSYFNFFFDFLMNHINCKIHIILHPTHKAQAVHSKVGTDAIVIHLAHHKYNIQNHKETTPIKYLLEHKLLAISGLKEITLTYGASESALYSEVSALIRKSVILRAS